MLEFIDIERRNLLIMNYKRFPLGALWTNSYLFWDENTKQAFLVDPGGKTDDVKKFLADMEIDNKGLQQLRTIHDTFKQDNKNWRMDPFSALFLLVLNFKWDELKNKDLIKLNIKKGSDRIRGIDF